MTQQEIRRGAAVEEGVEFDAFGKELQVGNMSPDAILRWFDPSTDHIEKVPLHDLISGKVAILHVVNSLNTPVCGSGLDFLIESGLSSGVVSHTISMDLPFALKDLQVEVGEQHKLLSAHLSDFGEKYGVGLTGEGDLDGLFMRAVFVIRTDGTIGFAKYVKDQGSRDRSEGAIAEAFEVAVAEVEAS